MGDPEEKSTIPSPALKPLSKLTNLLVSPSLKWKSETEIESFYSHIYDIRRVLMYNLRSIILTSIMS